MAIDTYRYLTSALIQVFGALIISGAIFYLFKLELLHKEQDYFKKTIALMIQMIDSYKTFITEHVKDYVGTVMAAESIAHLSKKEFDDRIEITDKCFENGVYNGDKQTAQNKFNYFKMKYEKNESETIKVKRNLLTSMIIVSVISIIIAFCLAFSDIIPTKHLFCVGISNILLSAIGFAIIVYFAINSLKEY